MLIQGQVGPTSTQSAQPGANPPIRMGQLGDVVVSELHGRFYEQTYRGNMFSYGMALTALTTTTATATGVTATATPILGVYNPITSSVNLVISQAALTITPNNLTSGAAPGAFVWLISSGQGAITTGSVPFNRKTLQQTGSQAKAFAVSTALTGLTGSLTTFEAADLPSPSGLTYTTLGSTAVFPSMSGTQNFDGQLIIPPGGVLALMNTVSSTVFSVAGRLMWEEVPL
jgi:hypothetical protein